MCGSRAQSIVVAHTRTPKTMQSSRSRYWEVRNSSRAVVVFHGDAEHENDSVSLYQRSAWPDWTNKPLSVVLQNKRAWETHYAGSGPERAQARPRPASVALVSDVGHDERTINSKGCLLSRKFRLQNQTGKTRILHVKQIQLWRHNLQLCMKLLQLKCTIIITYYYYARMMFIYISCQPRYN